MPCSIRECNGIQGLKSLPNANSDSERRKAWMRYCRDRTTQLKYPRVCMLHFSGVQMLIIDGKTYLRHDAVPDINLPSSSEEPSAEPPAQKRPPLVPALPVKKRPPLVPALPVKKRPPLAPALPVKKRPPLVLLSAKKRLPLALPAKKRPSLALPAKKRPSLALPAKREVTSPIITFEPEPPSPAGAAEPEAAGGVACTTSREQSGVLTSVKPGRRFPLKILVKPGGAPHNTGSAQRELHVNVVSSDAVTVSTEEDASNPRTATAEETQPEAQGDTAISNKSKTVIVDGQRQPRAPNKKGGVFKCPHCSYACVGPRILKGHVKRKHGHIGRDGRHKCDQCDYSTDHRGTLTGHMKRHSDARPHGCPHCDAAFRQRSHLTKHLQRHTGQALFVCDICGAEVVSRFSLTRHRRLHFPRPRHVCEVCGERFSDDANFSQHKRRKHMEREHLCDVCSARFVTRQQLEDHMQTHTGERPFSCEFCELTFKQSTSLYQHKRRSHTHDFRIWCDYCEKGFLANRDLQKHVGRCAKKYNKTKTPET